MSDTRVCTKCGRELSLDHFSVERKRGQPYRRADCKKCKSLQHTAWQQSRRRHYNAYMREYGKQYRTVRGDPTHPARAKRWALRRALRRVNQES